MSSVREIDVTERLETGTGGDSPGMNTGPGDSIDWMLPSLGKQGEGIRDSYKMLRQICGTVLLSSPKKRCLTRIPRCTGVQTRERYGPIPGSSRALSRSIVAPFNGREDLSNPWCCGYCFAGSTLKQGRYLDRAPRQTLGRGRGVEHILRLQWRIKEFQHAVWSRGGRGFHTEEGVRKEGVRKEGVKEGELGSPRSDVVQASG